MIAALAFATLLATAAASVEPGGPDDPLAQARAGRIECVTPIPDRKLCRWMLTYSFGPEGSISAREEMLLDPQRPISFAITTPRTMKGAAVCGTARLSDIQSGEILVARRPANASEDEAIRKALISLVRLHDRELCRVYARKGQGWTVQREFDGAPSRYPAESVIWVEPADGWKVGQ